MTSDTRQDRQVQLSIALLRPCVLAQLLGGSAHGYELHHRLLAIGLACDLGTVYRALNTMENEGLLCSTWERSQEGRSRHRFELSAAGEDMVDVYVPMVEQLIETGRAFLEMRKRAGGIAASLPGTDGAGVRPFGPCADVPPMSVRSADEGVTGVLPPVVQTAGR
jgi:DNA-binding PadR family transcriptional regulator